MSKLSEQLTLLSACKEAVEWAEAYETLAEAWAVCERGDWMLWLCGRMKGGDGWPTQQEVALAVCDCAELALPIYEARYPRGDRMRRCLEVIREWAHGRAATMEELELARSADDAYAYAAVVSIAAADNATLKQCADICRRRLKPGKL